MRLICGASARSRVLGLLARPKRKPCIESPPSTAEEIEVIVEAAGPRNGIEATAAVREFALAQTEDFTKRQAMEACNIKSIKRMATALRELQNEGAIKKIGTSKDARYRLCQSRCKA